MKIEDNEKRIKVTCPVCGYEMPIRYSQQAECKGVFVSCKGRNCRCIFEVKIEKGQQYK